MSLIPKCRRFSLVCALLVSLAALMSVASAPLHAADGNVFRLKADDRVALIGATFIERDRHYGYFESMIRINHPGMPLSFRNMAWPGDTTHVRLRPLNYGSFEENLAKQNPSVVMASYGVNDAFEGEHQLEKFLAGYRETLSIFEKLKLRTLIIAPPPFESIPGAPYNLEPQNQSLQTFVNATGQLAEEEKVSFANLFQSMYHPEEPTPYPLTDNGLHFTEFGYWKVSQVLAEQLGYNSPEWSISISAGKRKVDRKGVRIRDLQSTTSAVTFNAIDDQLPLVAPDSSPAGVELPHRRTLTVANLTPGNYTLLIDQQEILSGSADQWAKGMILDQGPQFEQAKQLRQEVVFKNDMFFFKWRAHNGEYIYGRRASVSDNWDPTKDGGNSGNPSFPKEMAEMQRLMEESDVKASRLSKPLSHQFILIRK
ncbi:hypothetical protein Pla110_46150 [Polystyrenella longa]|uniref:SGNH hydrolase-type esterase domain-containing protein n=1 Tax=Polystyrenella longa TaxID=2528007 RepID=A0A518CUF4_9PLAN|nr:SGNH/GDSL hydrolase family protein [Polystyrenella longa]QDU82852.1 hypothetical protein Pla110_46150 [Polystyrenella longa]